MLLKVKDLERARRRSGAEWSEGGQKKKNKVKKIIIDELTRLMTVQVQPVAGRRQWKPLQRTFADFGASMISSLFRFRSTQDLQRLMDGFQLPQNIKAKSYVFSGQEVLMISLLRLSFPLRWLEVAMHFPGRSRQSLQAAFYWFLEFMIQRWGYLLLNNMSYWLDHMQGSAEAIRDKLQNLSVVGHRQFHPPCNAEQGGFAIFAFIDNTMVAMCRPGGPSTNGERADPLMQRAWWTGWKKLHGMKWQTVTMANGMDFNVWGPASVRRNDLFTLAQSHILQNLKNVQEGKRLQFKIYGDSAYFDEQYLATGGGIGMSAVRESIEWRYKDLKTMWKYLDYRHVLKSRQQPISKMKKSLSNLFLLQRNLLLLIPIPRNFLCHINDEVF